MLEFIQHLKQRYQNVLSSLDSKHPYVADYKQRIEEMILCEAFIRKGILLEQHPEFPLQIAVIGPTQAGKSSVVNVLLNSVQAGVSPLAGYTVHPHGYCYGVSSDSQDLLQSYFGRFQSVAENALNRTRYDCYSVSQQTVKSELLPSCIVWDTPDFDSIDASDYREGVLRTLALADLIVLVVSKEKYADQSVWDVIKTLSPLQQSTLICLNKLNEGNETVLANAIRQNWQLYRKEPVPSIVGLNFQAYGALPAWPVTAKQSLHDLLKSHSNGRHLDRQQQLIRQYWQNWLEPVYAEHQAQRQWQALVEQVVNQALTDYRRDYLDHPHHYDTFQQALLNLLRLLEIPAISKAMSKTRRILTWPVRQLMSLGQSNSAYNSSTELTVLSQIGEHILIKLADNLAEKSDTDIEPKFWWRDLSIVLRHNRPSMLIEYQRALDTYQLNFSANIELAANRLYQKLQGQPVTLNSLRATRLTADTAAMLLAIQTGGIGLHDLFLTPMMLSMTSLLAESAIGSYMHRVEAELKTQQLSAVQDQVLRQGLTEALLKLPLSVVSNAHFAIPEADCLAAESSLLEKKNGLRLL